MYGVNGGLDIQSECDKGTKITLKLPVHMNKGCNENGHIRS
jgi:chemotaxis protein histidine kinase CheA